MPSSNDTETSASSSPETFRVPAVVCEAASKQFYVYEHRTTSLREWFIRSFRGRPLHLRHAEFSLRRFDLHIARGEAVALIGRNGSGKSTALRMMAGIYTPSTGSVTTYGRLAAVIELGAGFHQELTGIENVDLYGAILGWKRRELTAHRREILEFAGIGEFVHMPVKYYSSGMRARLAFAVAVCGRPEILLLDEVLAVGDISFQEKCLARLQEFRAEGGTLVVVSHDFTTLRGLCPRAVWLDNGAIRKDGPLEEVLLAYTS